MVDQNMDVVLENNKKVVSSFFFKYQSFSYLNFYLINKFINVLMFGGKRIKSEKLVCLFLKYIKLNFDKKINGVKELFKMFEKLKNLIEIKYVRIGKKVYQIPTFNTYFRQYFVGIRSFRLLIKKKKIFQLWYTILLEWRLLDSSDNRSILIRNKEQIFFSAIENRMFTHYRWK